jgi:uracil-DNA glycosylase
MTAGPPELDASADDRAELIEVVQALRAAVEWQSATGGTGLPRDPEARKRTQTETLSSASQAQPRPEPPAPTPDPPRARAVDPVRPSAKAAPTAALPVAQPAVQVAEGASLEVLRETVAACRTCGLCEQRKQTVFSRGSGKSGLCFVGEGPGADEDAQGEPFVGAAGQLLDRMIAAMGIERDDVYVANIVKCRPPDNRKPLPEEMAACVPYLHRQLELIAPTVIVALGATALEGLLGKTGGITRHRGKFSLYRGKIAVMPTFHPAYLLRQPSAKREVWSDLQEVLRHMGRPAKAP